MSISMAIYENERNKRDDRNNIEGVVVQEDDGDSRRSNFGRDHFKPSVDENKNRGRLHRKDIKEGNLSRSGEPEAKKRQGGRYNQAKQNHRQVISEQQQNYDDDVIDEEDNESDDSMTQPGAIAVPGLVRSSRRPNLDDNTSNTPEGDASLATTVDPSMASTVLASNVGGGHAEDTSNDTTLPAGTLEAFLVDDEEQQQIRRDLIDLQEEFDAMRHAPVAEVASPENNANLESRKTRHSMMIVLLISVLVIVVAAGVTVPLVLVQRNKSTTEIEEPFSIPPTTTAPPTDGSDLPTTPATPSPIISPPMYWIEEGRPLLGRNPGSNFGIAVAMSDDGRWIAGGGAEHLRVYDRAEEEWHDIENENSDIEFGYFINMSGDGGTLAVGSARDVRIYESRLTKLLVGTIDGPPQDVWVWSWEYAGNAVPSPEFSSSVAFFASSIALSTNGTIIATGDPNGGSAGQVHVFQKVEGWSPFFPDFSLYGQVLSGDNEDDYFGDSLALSDDGTIIAVGASQRVPYQNHAGTGTGFVRVFQFESGTWLPLGQDRIVVDDIEQEATDSLFGRKIALSSNGTVLAVSGAGVVNIYKLEDIDDNRKNLEASGKVWTQLGDTIRSDDDDEDFGKQIALSADGELLAVAGVRSQGFQIVSYVDIFYFVGGNHNEWEPLQRISGLDDGDGFGESIDLSPDGRILVGGAPGSDENGNAAGHIRILESF